MYFHGDLRKFFATAAPPVSISFVQCCMINKFCVCVWQTLKKNCAGKYTIWKYMNFDATNSRLRGMERTPTKKNKCTTDKNICSPININQIQRVYIYYTYRKGFSCFARVWKSIFDDANLFYCKMRYVVMCPFIRGWNSIINI